MALEHKDSLIIIDDFKARKVAQQFLLKIIGTLGIILEAKRKNIIPKVSPILNKIKETNFRISEQLESEIWRLADEL